MKQLSLAAHDFVKKPKQTRREKFIGEMEIVVPWTRLLEVIEPVYPKAGNGRRPYELPVMLRIHFMQHWFSYSDAAMEEALHDTPLLRRFAGLDASDLPSVCEASRRLPRSDTANPQAMLSFGCVANSNRDLFRRPYKGFPR